MKRICIYGKGGIGKSTMVSNVAATLALKGLRVAVVGCDPKADSTRNLTKEKIDTVLDCIMRGKTQLSVKGFHDVLCIESGGPEPGTGCAGRGIVAALNAIREQDLLFDRDVVLYDVLGDVVCGGFSAPMREQVADQLYLVTTDDYMSLYAANNICKGICKYAASGEVRLSGVIRNCRSSVGELAVAEVFAKAIGTRVIGTLPMDRAVSLAEIRHKTVIEAYPDAEIAGAFHSLARAILENEDRVVPTPLTEEALEELYAAYIV
jgi:nitrogenase iron protein NifH